MYSMTEVLAPTMIDYAAAGAGGRDGAAAAAGRRDLVPGLLRAEHRQQPRLPSPVGPCRTDDGWLVNGQKVWTSLAQLRAALRAARAHRHHRVRPPRDHRAVRRHGQPRHHRPPARGDARRARSSPRSSSTTCSCPFDRTLGDEGQGWAVAMDLLPYERSTALWHRGRLPAPPARPAARRGGARRGHRHARWGRRSSTSTPSGPDPSPPSAASTPARASAPETSIDKILIATAEQAVFDLAADGLADDGGPRRRPGGAAVAVGVPLLAGRHDLRRQLRDPAQHRRPPAARPRDRTDDGP